MPEKKKNVKLPTGASSELMVSTGVWKKNWSEKAEVLADSLAKAEWQPFSSRPRGDLTGFFVIFRWYPKQGTWVPLYMQHGSVCSLLSKITGGKEASYAPISKYLSSFPRSERKLLWVKWLQQPPTLKDEEPVTCEEVLSAFSAKYNSGEPLPFNMEEEVPLPENFSILDV